MSDEDEGSVITVCQGPPRCMLQGDEAEAAQRGGCIWCERIYIDPDGTERVEKPSEA